MTTQTIPMTTPMPATDSQRCAYQEQDAKMTLAEGLAEYQRANASVLFDPDAPDSEMNTESAKFFRRHDTCHVVFGCNTSIPQEAAADMWTIFGVDISLRDYYRALKLNEVQSLLDDVGRLRLAWASVKAVPTIWRAMWRARAMHKKWPWADHAMYLDRPLAEIRAEFGIRVL
ncbi:MAG: hypothetical protein Tsb0020_17750 [Haliangiales bacterium]